MGHLISATLMSIPGAIVIAKIIEPETTKNKSKNEAKISWQCNEVNSFEAACKGASDGLSCLKCCCNAYCFYFTHCSYKSYSSKTSALFGYSLSFQDILGIFRPIAFNWYTME